MSNRYIKTLSNKTEIDIRKIVSVSNVYKGKPCSFVINTQGDGLTMYFDTEEEAKEERIKLIEIWYSIAAEDAMNSHIYETRGE